MKTNFVVLALIALASAAPGWSQSGNAVDAQKLKDAASKGFGLNVGAAVPPSVRVEAVLLPARICSRLFGKEIANNYAAVELTVSNKNPDAEFLVHSVYLDYTDWPHRPAPPTCPAGCPAQPATTVPPAPAVPPPAVVSFQASTLEKQIASVEYRVARGEAQDAQLWSSRNWTMRTLTLLGVLATGSEFAFKEQGITKAIGAFTGQVVPAAGVFWPDGAQPQLDRISDFGFRTNKVIPKASADIIVAFFPLDRFITPGLKKIYLKSPAVFFLPVLGISDHSVPQEFRDIAETLAKGAPADETEAQKLDDVSMNHIRVMVGGTMTIDVDSVPARLDSLTFDGTPDWTKAGTVTGVLSGALLSNGQPKVDIAGDKPPDLKPQAVTDGSSDTGLHFTLTIPMDGVPACTVLAFHVVKTKDTKTVDSNKLSYTVPAAAGNTCPPAASKN